MSEVIGKDKVIWREREGWSKKKLNEIKANKNRMCVEDKNNKSRVSERKLKIKERGKRGRWWMTVG